MWHFIEAPLIVTHYLNVPLFQKAFVTRVIFILIWKCSKMTPVLHYPHFEITVILSQGYIS